MSDWVAGLEGEFATPGKHPEGEGWKTYRQIYDEMNCGHVKCRNILKKAMKAGKLETFTGSARTVNGTVARQVWYRKK